MGGQSGIGETGKDGQPQPDHKHGESCQKPGAIRLAPFWKCTCDPTCSLALPSGAFGLRKHEARCAVVADGDAGSRVIHAHTQTLEPEVCAVAYIHQEQR
jgi:hypothetical protein